MSNKRYLHIRILIAVIAWPFIFLNTGCKSSKRVATTVTTSPPKPLEDRSVQDLLEKLEKNSFKPEYLSAKASVVMKEGESETSFNITMRCKRDSIIWISISPLLGIEVARVLVTPDSVKFIDRIHGKYQASSFETINKILQLKVNFEIVQCILQGNFFAYKKNENRFNSVYIEDKYYILSSLTKKKLRRSLEEKDPNKAVIQDVFVNDSTFRVTQVQVEDQKIAKTLLTTYSDFRGTNAGVFPYKQETKVIADKNFDITIEYGKLNAGEPQEFPFSIPANYERIR